MSPITWVAICAIGVIAGVIADLGRQMFVDFESGEE